MSPRQFAMFYVITTNQGLFQPAPVPENGMNMYRIVRGKLF